MTINNYLEPTPSGQSKHNLEDACLQLHKAPSYALYIFPVRFHKKTIFTQLKFCLSFIL
jgi:hypothetical protein